MSPQRSASPKTILLIDDDAAVMKALSSGLRRIGYEVLTAETKAQAIAAVKGPAEVDLLMIDAVMPEISGPELAEILLFLRPRMKVIFITGLDGLAIRLAFDRPLRLSAKSPLRCGRWPPRSRNCSKALRKTPADSSHTRIESPTA